MLPNLRAVQVSREDKLDIAGWINDKPVVLVHPVGDMYAHYCPCGDWHFFPMERGPVFPPCGMFSGGELLFPYRIYLRDSGYFPSVTAVEYLARIQCARYSIRAEKNVQNITAKSPEKCAKSIDKRVHGCYYKAITLLVGVFR